MCAVFHRDLRRAQDSNTDDLRIQLVDLDSRVRKGTEPSSVAPHRSDRRGITALDMDERRSCGERLPRLHSRKVQQRRSLLGPKRRELVALRMAHYPRWSLRVPQDHFSDPLRLIGRYELPVAGPDPHADGRAIRGVDVGALGTDVYGDKCIPLDGALCPKWATPSRRT